MICQATSKPTISVGEYFWADQAMTVINDENEGAEPAYPAFFYFEPFTGECSDSGYFIRYFLSTSQNSETPSNDFPYGIESLFWFLYADLYSEESGIYEAYIIAKQCDTRIAVEISLE